MKKDSRQTLNLWKGRLERNLSAYQPEITKMVRRERQYNGDREIEPTTDNDKLKNGKKRTTAHVWNITAENIDAVIDSTIPMPKVVPLWKKDEKLARKIENMLRNELERLPVETINDRAERTAKKQGAVGLLPEWDHTQRTHSTVGENTLRTLHPQKIIPQDGVEDLEDMDYYFIRIPMTKNAVERRYGVDVTREEEAAPELRNGESAEDMVTLEIAVYKNGDGGIGRFVWVGDTVCEDLEDCQARRLRRCKKCGATEIDSAMMLDMPLTKNGEIPAGARERKPRKDECSYCGSRSWENTQEDSRQVPLSDLQRLGVRQDVIAKLEAKYAPAQQEAVLPQMPLAGSYMEMPAQGPTQMDSEAAGPAPTPAMTGPAEVTGMTPEVTVEIPYYKPNLYSMVLMRNVTAEGMFLGESDCDKLRDQQNTINRLEQKILDRVIKAGTKITAPPDSRVYFDVEDNDVIRITNLTDIALIKQFDFSGDLQYIFAHLNQAYTEGQRVMGVTESFLGRKDPTATSGKAKEFSAAQTVGRLESRRVLKKQAWGNVFERMFKNMLAYADERRPIHYQNEKGQTDYEEFVPYEFLEIDEAGELYWNTQFLFTCDDASGLAANREAMWQECTAHLQAGAYGNPTDVNALIIYWTKMEELHYPGAGNTKKLLEEQRQQQQQQQALLMQMQMQQQGQAAQPQQGAMPAGAQMPAMAGHGNSMR